MKIWIYRPDKAGLNINKELLYNSAGITYYDYKEAERQKKTVSPPFKKDHQVEVSND